MALIGRLLLLTLVLSSCSASWHVKRARQKNPSIFELKRDTVINKVEKVGFQFSPIVNREIELIQPVQVGGIQKEVKIKYVHDTVTNTVKIEADCPDCETIYETEKIYVQPTFWDKAKYGFGTLVVIAVITFLYRILIGRFNQF